MVALRFNSYCPSPLPRMTKPRFIMYSHCTARNWLGALSPSWTRYSASHQLFTRYEIHDRTYGCGYKIWKEDSRRDFPLVFIVRVPIATDCFWASRKASRSLLLDLVGCCSLRIPQVWTHAVSRFPREIIMYARLIDLPLDTSDLEALRILSEVFHDRSITIPACPNYFRHLENWYWSELQRGTLLILSRAECYHWWPGTSQKL